MKKETHVEMTFSGLLYSYEKVKNFTTADYSEIVRQPIGKTFKVATWYIEDKDGYYCDEWGYVHNIIFAIIGKDKMFKEDLICRLVAIL